MARGQQKTRKRNNRTKKPVSKQKNRKHRRGVIANKQSSRGTLGTVIHQGLRSVLSLLPGASITPQIADLVFKVLSNGFEVSPGVMEASVYALHAAFYITPATLMGNVIAGSSTINVTDPNPEARTVVSNYDCYRVSHFKLHARNTSLEACGIWAIGFWPFVSKDDGTKLPRKVYYLADIRLAPQYVEGPASQPLTLRHYFTPSEFIASEPGGINRTHGLIAIAYTDVSRSTYGRINADSFKPQLELSGNVVMSSRMSHDNVTFRNTVTQVPASDAVVTPNGVYYSSGPVEHHDRGNCVRLHGNFEFSKFAEEDDNYVMA